MSIDELIKKTKEIIQEKNKNNQSQLIDESFLAKASVYKHGNSKAKIVAENWLINFFVNSGMVTNKKEITTKKSS